MFVKIAKIGTSQTIELAALELKKYLSIMDDSVDYAILSYDKYYSEYKDVLWLGICDEFEVPDVKNKELDDAISVQVKGGYGYITGTNDRSVLIGVYRYLRELGCSFIRPSSDGEVIPSINLVDTSVSLFEAASYRHRAVCIEGANDFNVINDFIEWLPKVGLNGFYNQFRVPFVFYDRWYQHKKNEENFDSYNISVADAEGLTNQSIIEIKKRGLLYHAVGHGWTCEPFGIDGIGWYHNDSKPDEKIRKYFAKVNGERDYWKGVPLNTNLCYSSFEVKDIISSAITDYSINHKEVDYLHVWLADGSNNHCECDECVKLRPADHYVQLLNEIDRKLTDAGLDTKIVFLIYVDLLWAPIKERLNNPDRFVLMFAPITRTYSSSMASSKPFDGVLADYNRNNNKMPSSVSENIAHLKNWQKDFECDSFDFDYHYMWDHFKDIGHFGTDRVLFEDMKNLDKLGLNGMVSCQCIRAFFPHGLGMYCMAEALWNKNADFDNVTHKYFNAAFGDDGDIVSEYMKKLTTLSDPVYMRGEYENTERPKLIPDLEEAKRITCDFRTVIEKNISYENAAVALSYKYLLIHNEFVLKYLDMEIELAKGDTESAKVKLGELTTFINNNEKQIYRVFDAYVFKATMKKCFDKIIK